MSSTHELWEQFEELEVERYQISSKVYLLNDISRISQNTPEKERVQLEKDLLYFMRDLGHLMERLDLVDKKGIELVVSQFVSSHDEKIAEYYRDRYNNSQNIFDKWRYAFCYWIITKKEPSFLTHSIDGLFTCIDKRFQQKNYQECLYLLVKVFNLSRLYNRISTYKEKVVNYSLQLLEEARQIDDHSPRMITTPVELINLNKQSVSSQRANELISVLSYEANLFRKKGDHIRYRLILEPSFGLCNLLDLAETEKTNLKEIIQRTIAESCIAEGNTKLEQGNAIHATLCYKQAIDEYRKIGDQAKIDGLTREMRSINDKVQAEMEETVIKFELPNIQFTATDGYSLVKQIVQYTERFIPSRNDIRARVNQDLNEHPLIRAVGSSVTFGTKNLVSFNEDEESIIDSEIIGELNHHILLTDLHIASSVKKLQDAKKISSKNFIDFLSDCGLDESLLKLIANGIERHFEGNYIASIHVLIPQVEATLRYLLNKKGITTLKTKGDIIMDNELGGLLRDAAYSNVLPEDLVKSLELKYTEQVGMNLRNSVSHGLLDYTAFTYAESLATVRAILLLAQLSLR
jgi:hypothetical protein